MIPKYTIVITNNETGEYVKGGVDKWSEWKKKLLSGKTAYRELLDQAELRLDKK